MSAVTFATAYAALRERFQPEHGDPARQLVADLTGRPIAEVARAIGAVVSPRTEEVVVLWPHDGRASRMPVSDLLGNLPGLWHPGEDDLLTAGAPRQWVVLLDHQAHLWFTDD
jgi:hypothetical protein